MGGIQSKVHETPMADRLQVLARTFVVGQVAKDFGQKIVSGSSTSSTADLGKGWRRVGRDHCGPSRPDPLDRHKQHAGRFIDQGHEHQLHQGHLKEGECSTEPTAESEITKLAKQKWRRMRREQKHSVIQNHEEEELRAGNG